MESQIDHIQQGEDFNDRINKTMKHQHCLSDVSSSSRGNTDINQKTCKKLTQVIMDYNFMNGSPPIITKYSASPIYTYSSNDTGRIRSAKGAKEAIKQISVKYYAV